MDDLKGNPDIRNSADPIGYLGQAQAPEKTDKAKGEGAEAAETGKFPPIKLK